MIAPPSIIAPAITIGTITQIASRGTIGRGMHFEGDFGRQRIEYGGHGQARVFVLNPQDVQTSNAVGTGILDVCSKQTTVLFDSSATHSFICSSFTAYLNVEISMLDNLLMLLTLIGEEYSQ